MRKFLISLMAASMLVPVAANAADRDSRRADRQAERSERRSDNRAERVERQAQQRAERQETRNVRAERQPRAERTIERNQPVRQVERVQRVDRDRRVERNQPVRQVQQVQPVQQVQHVDRTRRVVRDDNLLSGIREAARQQHERGGDRDRDWRDGRHDRDWSRDWRRDNRYDWYNYRHRYGSLFRLGRYYDPYGWGYRRFSIGFSLWPSYYGSGYWLDDPWQYRLPPAYAGTRWVRYYDDVLLVDMYTGEVIDVIYDFFW